MNRDIASARVGKVTIWLVLVHYYTHISGFISYLFVFLKKPKISKLDLLLFLGLLFLLIMQLFIKSPFDLAYDFRYHWGWAFFYLIFKGAPPNFNTLKRILVWLCVLTLAEAILVNTVISVQILPNYLAHSSNIVSPGVYQRPFSFGGMPQVGAPLLVVLMALCNVQGWRLWLSILAVLSLASGTGFSALALLLLIRYHKYMIKMSMPIFLFIMSASLLLHNEFQHAIHIFMAKMRFSYFLHLYDLLSNHIAYIYSQGKYYMFMIGYPNNIAGNHGGDWGILTFFTHNGIYGVILILFFVYSRVNKFNRLPLLIIFGSSIHYAAMSYFPGQMILGLLLSIGRGGMPRHVIKINPGEADSPMIS